MGLFLAGVDFETALTEPGQGVPPWVCFSWGWMLDGQGEGGIVTSRGEWEGHCPPGYPGAPEGSLVDASVVLRALMQLLRDARAQGHTARHVNQNQPFDFLVSCHHDETLLTDVFKLYRDGFVEDTMIREMLIDLAAGYLGFVRGAKNKKTGKLIKRKYSLEDIAMRRLKKTMDKETHRKHFWSLVETPLKDWPQGAKDYVVGDCDTAFEVYLDQRAEVMQDIDSGEIPNCIEQSQAHWALNLMSAWGIRTHPGRVAAFKRRIELDLEVLKQALQVSGFIRTGKKESKNKAAIGKYLVRIADSVGFELPRTPPSKKFENGQISQKAAVIDDLLEMLNVNFFPASKEKTEQEQAVELAKTIIAGDIGTDELVSLEVGELDEDGEPVGEKKNVQLADSDLKSLAVLAFHTSTQKLLKTYVPPMIQGTTTPINAKYNPIVNTGRISCSKPNLTNLPRAPGVRECYIPREGFIFCSVDYNSMELHTLAQSCITLVGQSKLADALNAGIDPHLAFACEHFLDGLDYEEGKRIRKSVNDEYKGTREDPRKKEIGTVRDMSKCFHPDTEFCTPCGWVHFEELDEESYVLQAEPIQGQLPKLSWVHPFNLFKKSADKLVHLYGEGIDIRVTDDHRMLAYTNKGAPLVCRPEELNVKRGWWNSGELPDHEETTDDISESLMRFLVAAQADGSYTGGFRRQKFGVRFGFSKQRKIDRFRNLLDLLLEEFPDSTVNHRYYQNEKMGKCQFWEIHGELAEKCRVLLPGKIFPQEWALLSSRLREIVLDEARYWDAHTPANGVAYQYSTTIKQNSEVLQLLATLSGRKTRLRVETHVNPEHNNCYKLTVRTKGESRGGNLETTVEPYEGEVVCLSVPSSFVVVRSGGVAVITGQCGNFGLPGGLGAEKFVAFCKQSGVLITIDQAKEIKKKWLLMWPEMKDYFKYINGLMQEDEEGEAYAIIEHLFVGRVHGRTRYTAACNSFFQGLGADLAKAACFELAEACYVPGVNKILYGSRLSVFVHDECIMEHPMDGSEHERAMEQTRIMCAVSPRFVPDVPLRAEPALMPYWTKKAEAMYDANNRLIPWTPN